MTTALLMIDIQNDYFPNGKMELTSPDAAVEYGYSCQVIEDACATTSLEIGDKVIPAEQIHYAFMAALNGGFATVKGTSEFLK